VRIVLLIPVVTDTRTFQRAFSASTTCLFLQSRVKFGVLRETVDKRLRHTDRRCSDSAWEPLADLGATAKPVVRQLALFG
jgi:hypothetical protein